MSKSLTRREFLETTVVGAGVLAFSPSAGKESPPDGRFSRPVAVSTWRHGVAASRIALKTLDSGGSALDGVEMGINAVEKDPQVDSVGVGGLPNEDGEVELDAAIMEGSLRCGAVMGLQKIATPISVARRVMERTRHIQLSGSGALQFALMEGFPVAELLTPEAKAAWEAWQASPGREVPGQVKFKNSRSLPLAPGGKQASGGHDTVTTLVLDVKGSMAAGCSTSGLKWKMPGRIGDSPIIGAGLYCDGAAGAAGATGIGEEILRVCGSFLIVEGMRRGLSPAESIDEALRRVAGADPKNRKRQVAFIALSKTGEVGAGAMIPGFQAAVAAAAGKEILLKVPKWKG